MLDQESLEKVIEFISELSEIRDKGKEIEPYETYGINVDLFEQIRVHSQLHDFPSRLIKASAPNETQAEFDYKKATYQPVTRPIWKEATTQINRIFNRQNYSIKGWGNNEGVYEDVPAQDYFESDYPWFGSLMSYFENVVKPAKDEDPNAVLALDLKYIEFPDTELPESYLKIYHCNKVILNENDFAVVLTDERSEVKEFNKTVKKGLVFKLYDSENIYLVKQYGEYKEFTFEIEVYYSHNLGYVPVELLKGQPKMYEGKLYYESLFADAVPMLNDVTIDATNLRVNKVANLFMERIEWVDECDFDGCTEGFIMEPLDDGGFDKRACPACHGHGKRTLSSPLGVTQIQIGNRFNDTDGYPNFDPVTYVKKDSSMIEALRKEINYNIENSFSFMGIEISTDKKSGKETATAKLIDRESLFSFISLYSNQIFDLVEWSIWTLGRVRYPDFVMPEVRRPISFALRSESDLAKELQESTELPDAVRSQMTKEYLNVRFANNERLKATIDLKEKLDNYYLQSPESVLALMASGVLPKWKATLHFSFDSYIAQQDNSFFELEFEQQKQILEALAQRDTNEMIVTTDKILSGDEIPENADVESEAKARLKGSVGGVQGILEIQSSVAQGLTDYSAGLAILNEIYGFDAKIARSILGTPKKIKPIDGNA